MQSNPYRAKGLRSYPRRFVLPLFESTDKTNSNKNTNLGNILNTKAEACVLPNGTIFVKPEKLCNIGCDLPSINHQYYSGQFSFLMRVF